MTNRILVQGGAKTADVITTLLTELQQTKPRIYERTCSMHDVALSAIEQYRSGQLTERAFELYPGIAYLLEDLFDTFKENAPIGYTFGFDPAGSHSIGFWKRP